MRSRQGPMLTHASKSRDIAVWFVVAAGLLGACSASPEERFAAEFCQTVEAYLAEDLDVFSFADEGEAAALRATAEGADLDQASAMAELRCGDAIEEANRKAESTADELTGIMDEFMEETCDQYPDLETCQ